MIFSLRPLLCTLCGIRRTLVVHFVKYHRFLDRRVEL